MNNKTVFEIMLDQMWELQTSIITVEGLDEEFYCQPAYTSHIVIPDGKNKVTDFMFVRGRNYDDFLASVHSLDMSFNDAIVEFSKRTMGSMGAVLKLHAN